MTISTITTFGYGSFGSPAACVTLGYTAGAAIVQQNTIGWSGRPGANQRKQKRKAPAVIPPGLFDPPANDDQLDKEYWDKVAERRRADAAARKEAKVQQQAAGKAAKEIEAQAAEAARKALDAAVKVAKAKKVTPPPVRPEVAQKAPPAGSSQAASVPQVLPEPTALASPTPAPQVDLTQVLNQLSTTVVQQMMERVAAQLLAIVGPVALAMHALEAQVAELKANAQAHTQAQAQAKAEQERQAAETDRRRKDAERRSAQEAARQKQIVREREAWQRRISSLLQSAQAVHQRPRAGDRRREAH